MATTLLIGFMLSGCWLGPPPRMADIGTTQLAHGAEIDADEPAASEILAMFQRAEQALKAKDLDLLMTMYSDSYKYQGLRKDSLRRIWADLFRDHDNFSTSHVFTRIIVSRRLVPPVAEVTCTGSIWATEKSTGQRANIDSWYSEVHHLVYENGAWRIQGHAWERREPLPPILWPHPFF